MPIRASTAPPDVTAKVADDLGALGRARGDIVQDAGGGAGDPVACIPVFGIAREALNQNGYAALADAKPIGWRYLVKDGDGVSLVDRFGTVESGTSRVIRGSSVERYGNAGSLAESDIAEHSATFEPRVLDFGVLGQSELWLHSPDAEDRFYSLGKADPTHRDTAAVMAEALGRAERQSSTVTEDETLEHDDRGG